MKHPNSSRMLFLFVVLCATMTLIGCSPDAPEQKNTVQLTGPAETVPETPVEPEPGKELPEVVVLYGREDFVPFLESKDWWGEVDRGTQLVVPHFIITAIHPSWQEYSKTLPVPVKKQLFYRLMMPLVMHANSMALDFRERLQTARGEYTADGAVSPESLVVIKRLAFLLPGMNAEGVEEIAADNVDMDSMLDALLDRVDIVPAGLALGQAAYESGYGTSRFAVEGNSLFGQWTYKGDGIKPKEQRMSSKGDHRIKTFEWPFDSVRGYFINLMSHPAYEDFRRLRAEFRQAGKPLGSMELANGLLRYSERGQEYVDSLKGIMRVNKLDLADTAVFSDEPMYFLISEESREDVAKTKARIADATKSGEALVILERMRLK